MRRSQWPGARAAAGWRASGTYRSGPHTIAGRVTVRGATIGTGRVAEALMRPTSSAVEGPPPGWSIRSPPASRAAPRDVLGIVVHILRLPVFVSPAKHLLAELSPPGLGHGVETPAHRHRP